MRAIIVGAGHAAAQLCASLRQEGWDGEIVLIGDEPALPYQRPPLSKTYLAGETSLDDLLIRPPEFYDSKGVTIRHATVASIDREGRTVTCSDGEVLVYDQLALCTGSRPRRLPLPGAELPGVHHLRNAADIEAIRAGLGEAGRVAIVGAGYVGLETAASLRKLGVDVTVLEAAPHVLQRVTAPPVSAFYERVHREEGVDLRTGVEVAAIEGDDHVRGVRLADGELVETGLVVVGIGVVPNVELAQAAGLPVDDGVVIDDHALTGDPRITAAGDCTSHLMARYDRQLRLESVPSAVEQAKSAAASMCGKQRAIQALPWFWSDQYDLKLQTAGLSTGHDSTLLRGDPASGRSFACFYFVQDELVAADCVNRPQEFMLARRVIGEGLAVDREGLADEGTAVPDLLKAALASRVGA